MSRVIYEELQDKEGNVHYLHTEDKPALSLSAIRITLRTNLNWTTISGETDEPRRASALNPSPVNVIQSNSPSTRKA